jgi:hypothetical protein
MSETHDPADTELASKFTVRDYEKARDTNPPNRAAIADAIHRRFTERYITPARAKERHGFTMMAISCLMIEALESFRQGWDTSDGRSKAAFCFFIDASDPFKELRGHALAFYIHVRCGILHQAETTGGWRIRRDSSALFDASGPTVNAKRFLQGLEDALKAFCDDLKSAAWNSPEWKKARHKLNAIVRHCREGAEKTQMQPRESAQVTGHRR